MANGTLATLPTLSPKSLGNFSARQKALGVGGSRLALGGETGLISGLAKKAITPASSLGSFLSGITSGVISVATGGTSAQVGGSVIGGAVGAAIGGTVGSFVGSTLGSFVGGFFGGSSIFGGSNRKRRAARQQAAFAATANAKGAFNASRTSAATSTGELLAVVEDTKFFNQGSQRFSQPITLPITKGNPEGFLDIEHRSVAELASGLTGGNNLGSTGGVFLRSVTSASLGASIIKGFLDLTDPEKSTAFVKEITTGVRANAIFDVDPHLSPHLLDKKDLSILPNASFKEPSNTGAKAQIFDSSLIFGAELPQETQATTKAQPSPIQKETSAKFLEERSTTRKQLIALRTRGIPGEANIGRKRILV